MSVDRLLNKCKEYVYKNSSYSDQRQKYYLENELLKQHIKEEATVSLAESLQLLNTCKPDILKAFHHENKEALLDESMTQSKVVEQYNMRKLENISEGYYKMLEKVNRKKHIELNAQKKRIGEISL